MIVHSYVCEKYYVGTSVSESSPLIVGDLISLNGITYKVVDIVDLLDKNYNTGKLVSLSYEENFSKTSEVVVVDILNEVNNEFK